jgi:hypothetical protein
MMMDAAILVLVDGAGSRVQPLESMCARERATVGGHIYAGVGCSIGCCCYRALRATRLRGEQARRHAPTNTHRRTDALPPDASNRAQGPPDRLARSLSPASIGSLSARRRPPTRDHMGLLAVPRVGNRRGGTRRPAPGRGPSPLCTLVNGRQAASHPLCIRPLQPPSMLCMPPAPTAHHGPTDGEPADDEPSNNRSGDCASCAWSRNGRSAENSTPPMSTHAHCADGVPGQHTNSITAHHRSSPPMAVENLCAGHALS